MADILNVTKRDATGTKAMRKLRENNMTPAVYYEPGKESIALSVSTKELHRAVEHGSREVELQGDLTQTAAIQSLQWDAFGSTVLHLDLTPVSVYNKSASGA